MHQRLLVLGIGRGKTLAHLTDGIGAGVNGLTEDRGLGDGNTRCPLLRDGARSQVGIIGPCPGKADEAGDPWFSARAIWARRALGYSPQSPRWHGPPSVAGPS